MDWERLGKLNGLGRKKTHSYVTRDMKKSDKSGELFPLVGTEPLCGPRTRTNSRDC